MRKARLNDRLIVSQSFSRTLREVGHLIAPASGISVYCQLAGAVSRVSQGWSSRSSV